MNYLIDADRTDVYEVELDSVAPESPSMAVVHCVAALTDRTPSSLDPIGDAVDPEALDTFVASAGGDSLVTFRYEGYLVEVLGGERLRFVPTSDRSVGPERD